MAQDDGVLGVGSIVDVEGTKLMVSGYRLVEDSGMVALAYVVLPYPLGYVSEGSVSLLSTEPKPTVVRGGFAGEGSDDLLQMLKKAREEGASTPFEDYASAMSQLYGELSARGEDDE